MRVDAHVAQSASRPASPTALHMLLRARIKPITGHAEVDHPHGVCTGIAADQKVVGLDISVEQTYLVHMLQAIHHLVSQAEHRLQPQALLAEVEQILERRSKQLRDHHVAKVLGLECMHERYAASALEQAASPEFSFQVLMVTLGRLHLDGNVLARLSVLAHEHFAEGPHANFRADGVASTDICLLDHLNQQSQVKAAAACCNLRDEMA
mmetsp:Transcript_112186/g.302751  ORF Transcript_112186/g.302751 Transcript_112186/m.302751 type:complete len:209 (-) Transcript_112186:3-629(-)